MSNLLRFVSLYLMRGISIWSGGERTEKTLILHSALHNAQAKHIPAQYENYYCSLYHFVGTQ